MLQRDFNHLEICTDKYPNVFVLTAKEGTEEEGYTETTKCDRDRHIIYSSVPCGKSLLQAMYENQHCWATELYQVGFWCCDQSCISSLIQFFRSALILMLCLSTAR